MAEAKVKYATSASITCTVTSLADGGYRESAAIDNSTNLYMDALVSGSILLNATLTGDGYINIFGYGSIDGGTVYSGGLAGTDETITWGTTPASSSVEGYNNLKLIGVASSDDTDDANYIEFGPFSVAAAFGGVLPISWGIVVENQTNAAFDATGASNTFDYVGVTYTSA